MNYNLFVHRMRYTALIFTLALFVSCSMKKDVSSVLLLDDGWQIHSSQQVTERGEELTSSEGEMAGWHNATVPSTVLGTLVKNGVYPDIFMGKNFEEVDKEQFQGSWWYRKVFEVKNQNASTYHLEFDGIIYRANIWLNGNQIASADTLAGPFRQFAFNISKLVRKSGENILAVEVFPPAAGDFTVGFVDWNPESPDRGMGIWREVRLSSSGDVSLKAPFVQTKLDTATLKQAELLISAEVVNNSNTDASGYLEAQIGDIKIRKEVNLLPNETKLIRFSPEEFPSLKIDNPRIWWTHDLGKPELYDLKLAFYTDKQISDRTETQFGIRDIQEYTYNKYEREHKGYKLNGKKILIKGGGWVDQLFLIR